MRGISFQANHRPDKPTPTSPHLRASATLNVNPPTSAASKMIKKLSTTFRRKSNVSPTNILSASQALAPSPHVSHPTVHPDSTASFPSHQPGHKTRAMTFSAGTPTEHYLSDTLPDAESASSSSASKEIPFFKPREQTQNSKRTPSHPPSQPRSGNVAVVRGKPAWFDPNLTPDAVAAATAVANPAAAAAAPAASAAHRSNAHHMYPRQLSHQPQATHNNAHNDSRPPRHPREDATYSRHRHYSFDIDRTRQKHIHSLPPTNNTHLQQRQQKQQLQQQTAVAEPAQHSRQPTPRRSSRRRWLLPLPESPDTPGLITPPPGSTFEKISRPRDKAEARVLASACTYLESEIERIIAQLQPAAPACCTCPNKNSKDTNPSDTCQCPHRAFMASTAERLKAVLFMMEDRYDSIEQVYVKSEEYARAMGNFFQMTPNEFTRMVSDKDIGRRDSRKSAR